VQIIQYIINAFTSKPFAGNPAAVVPLSRGLPDAVMQQIAWENNLSETAFFVSEPNQEADGLYALRWFTPVREVDFCGHATLAAAHIVLHHKQLATDSVRFSTRRGVLSVVRLDDGYQLDFPRLKYTASNTADQLSEALGVEVLEAHAGDDLIARVKDQATVVVCQPDMQKLAALDTRGIIITAPGDEVDFVSRFFAPKFGIDEDPVTGSAHCMLAPYWAEKLNKTRLSAQQLSVRGGEMVCEVKGGRVIIDASAVTWLIGKIYI